MDEFWRIAEGGLAYSVNVCMRHNLEVIPNKPISQIKEQFDLGKEYVDSVSVSLLGLHAAVPQINNLRRGIEAATGTNVFGASHLTPRNSQTFGVHYDRGSTVAVQAKGQKEWRVIPPVISAEELDNDTRTLTYAEKTAEPFLHETLQPGDALFIPRGWRHGANTEDKPSLHVSLGILHHIINPSDYPTLFPESYL